MKFYLVALMCALIYSYSMFVASVFFIWSTVYQAKKLRSDSVNSEIIGKDLFVGRECTLYVSLYSRNDAGVALPKFMKSKIRDPRGGPE